jgi:hypothetical protein
VTFALLTLLLQFAHPPANAGHYAIALIASCSFAFLVTRPVSSVWSAGSVANGLLGIGVATGLFVQNDIWAGRYSYNDDIERAIGSLAPFLWAWALRVGIIVALLTAIWLAFSYWLARPHSRRPSKPTSFKTG